MDKVINNRYEIWEKLGSGGFANIFHGWDLLRDREIAIKIILSNLAEDEKLKAMFLDEGHMAGRLDHPNIVHLYDIGQTSDGLYYLVMEYVDGYDLAKLMLQHKKMGSRVPIELSCFIIMQICEALEYAHRYKDLRTGQPLSMVHRDVTPANILISKGAEVKLTDFGIAKVAFGRRDETRVGELKGKLTYMSPEQALGNNKPLDARSDLFSLGIVFYELLTGLYVYEGTNEVDIHRKVIKAEINQAVLTSGEVPEPLQKIVLCTLQKDPEDRFASAQDLRAAIESFVGPLDASVWRDRLQSHLLSTFEPPARAVASTRPDEERTRQTIGDTVPRAAADTAVLSAAEIGRANLEKDKTLKMENEKEKRDSGESDADRTRLDIIIDTFRYHKKIIRRVLFSLLALAVVFVVMDTLMQWTAMGRRIYYWFIRPNTIIESIPPGARVFIEGRAYENPTPLPVRLDPLRNHAFELHLPGYEPIQGLVPILTNVDTPFVAKKYFEARVSFASLPTEADVYLQNVLIGRTPLLNQRLQVGREYSIRYERAGFNSLTGRFNLLNQPSFWDMNTYYWKAEAGSEATRKNFQIRGELHKNVRFIVRPAGAVWQIDDVAAENIESEKVVALTAAIHRIQASKPGWQSQMKTFMVDENTEVMELALLRPVRFRVRSSLQPADLLHEAVVTVRESGRSGKADETFLLGPQPYHVRIVCPGYKEEVLLIPAELLEVEVSLELNPPMLSFMVVDAATGDPLDKVMINWHRRPTDIWNNLGRTETDGTLKNVEVPVSEEGEIIIYPQLSGYLKEEIIQRVMPGKTHSITVRLKRIP